ncbi:MAG: ABC transporter permease [Zetaproteobacteria bacterium]|nr:ABC transporter permease [Pseudobdellovibrionaceae bacterium]
MFPEQFVFDFAQQLNDWMDALILTYGDQFGAFSDHLTLGIVKVEALLRQSPWWLVVLVIGGISYLFSRKVMMSLSLMGVMISVGVLGLWDQGMQTLALMLMSAMCVVVLGIPVGIVMARNDWFRRIALPILDGMQTLPTFVYLIPAIMLFGLGKVPALLATVVYAVPPLIRMTDLGIRMVDREIIEASNSFGADSKQLLWGVQFPLAFPNIMAGVNQSTMMALSMVVLSSMIGARGLGEQVLLGIQRLNVGQGLQGGLAIVALAIVLDRLTQNLGRDHAKDSH